MSQPDDIPKLTAEIRSLVAKLDAPKRKDWTDRLSVISAFVSTVVVALLGLYFTHSAERAASAREERFQEAQIANQRAQVRIEELKALTSVAPLLASQDSAQRAVARTILDAVDDTRTTHGSASTGTASPARTPITSRSPASVGKTGMELSLLDRFIARARDEGQSDQARVDALRQIEVVATSSGVDPQVRERALGAASSIAVTPGIPGAVRRTAEDVIGRIQSVDSSRIASIVAEAPLTRPVREIVIHHTALPRSAYRGASTLLDIAQFQLGQMGWRNVSWHYAIAPDGSVWLGMPLDEPATHATGHNRESISVLLLMNGDRELPTDVQRRSFGLVMRSVQRKSGLAPGSREAALLHRDLPRSGRTCPGKLVTQEQVASWISSG